MEEVPNLSYVEEIAGEDRDFEKQFVQRLKEEFLWEVGMYLRCMKRKESRAAAEIVAKSKHKFSMLGLNEAYRLASIHEENLQSDNVSLHQEFGKILKKVNTFLERIDSTY